MITILDYGLGNVKAFANVYKKLNISTQIIDRAENLKNVSKLILPGVGAFDFAMKRLEDSGMRQTLNELVLGNRVPVLGICVGMQMLAKSSEEGELPGLGWIDGEVKRFDVTKLLGKTHLPHMGWNNVAPINTSQLFHNFNSDSRFYFLHSYYFSCNKKENVIATTNYGEEFTSAVNSENIYGVQFHPEKSHQWGVQLLYNFANLK